ncbi:MAG: hypothetical protein KGJ49_04370 [Alphaproteobacteria bacterium]|nr:hypothetical protein [Alphaproteobacteria bacterium]
MTKRGRPAKAEQEALLPITILIPPRLKQALENESSAAGRPLSETVRRRIVQHEDRASATSDEHLSPPRALGWLIELHANDILPYSQSAEEWQAEMKASVPALLQELFGGSEQKAEQHNDSFAVAAARSIAQKVLRAHLLTSRSGNDSWATAADLSLAQEIPSLGKLQPTELLRIQVALGLSPSNATAAAKNRRLRKE